MSPGCWISNEISNTPRGDRYLDIVLTLCMFLQCCVYSDYILEVILRSSLTLRSLVELTYYVTGGDMKEL